MIIVYSILGTFNSGGMERVLSNKANYLTKHGYQIIIITTDQKGRSPFFALDPNIKCIDLAINYTDDLGKGVVKKTLSYIRKKRKHYHALKKVLLTLKADVVISMFDNDADFLYKINDGSKKIIEIHFSKFKRMQYNRKGIFKYIDIYQSQQDQKIVQKYDRFVVLTNEDKGYWGEIGNIEVIPNANTFFAQDIALLDRKQALAIGRFDYQKGFDDLINAWALVNNENKEWILNIYGDGPMKNELEKLIDRFTLQNVVYLKKPTKDIKSVYLDHSIMVMTSRYEGLPMVLLEAQAAGLPLVSYACKCGPRDLISDNGILVEEGNIKEMAQSLLVLINDVDLRKRMGISSVQNSKNFTEDFIMGKWISLFNNLLSR